MRFFNTWLPRTQHKDPVVSTGCFLIRKLAAFSEFFDFCGNYKMFYILDYRHDRLHNNRSRHFGLHGTWCPSLFQLGKQVQKWSVILVFVTHCLQVITVWILTVMESCYFWGAWIGRRHFQSDLNDGNWRSQPRLAGHDEITHINYFYFLFLADAPSYQFRWPF